MQDGSGNNPGDFPPPSGRHEARPERGKGSVAPKRLRTRIQEYLVKFYEYGKPAMAFSKSYSVPCIRRYPKGDILEWHATFAQKNPCRCEDFSLSARLGKVTEIRNGLDQFIARRNTTIEPSLLHPPQAHALPLRHCPRGIAKFIGRVLMR